MSEALLACGRCRYYWVASAPYPPYKGGALSPRRCCSTVRLPPIHRRPLGFARPPHGGFALLAAHTRTCTPCYERTIQSIPAPRNTTRRNCFPMAGEGRCIHVAFCALEANFRESPKGEVRRTPAASTRVDRGIM